MNLFGDDDIAEDNIDDFDSNSSISIEKFDHPRSMTFLMGHEAVEKELLDLFNSGRMPHGIILSGVSGIGKATLAYRFARFLLKHGNADDNQDSLFGDGGGDTPTSLDVAADDPVFSKVSSGGHPDLLTIERLYDATKNKTAATLAVSELRRVEPFLRMTSSNGGWRVVIIDDADTMNRNAQNALLKILEEPPKKTLIMLVTHRLGALIPTIRSRTRLLNIKPLPQPTISELLNLKGHELDLNQKQIITAMAENSFGQSCNILEQGGLESFATIITMLQDISWTDIHAFADQLGRAGQEQAYQNFKDTILWIYKSLSFAKARGLPLSPDALNTEPLSTILNNSSLAQLLKICENLSSQFDQTERSNLDKKQAILRAFEIITA